jgi:hypothetical protein
MFENSCNWELELFEDLYDAVGWADRTYTVTDVEQ